MTLTLPCNSSPRIFCLHLASTEEVHCEDSPRHRASPPRLSEYSRDVCISLTMVFESPGDGWRYVAKRTGR